jgi:hypothetical protein
MYQINNYTLKNVSKIYLIKNRNKLIAILVSLELSQICFSFKLKFEKWLFINW